MGTQDFPLHPPNHETTLNAKPILIFALWLRLNVVISATLECHIRYPKKHWNFSVNSPMHSFDERHPVMRVL